MAIRTVGVAIKPGETRALAAVRDLAKWLAERARARLLRARGGRRDRRGRRVRAPQMVREADLLVVLGGDGTLLCGRARRRRTRGADPRHQPRHPRLPGRGLVDEMHEALARALAGEMTIEPRMRLAGATRARGPRAAQLARAQRRRDHQGRLGAHRRPRGARRRPARHHLSRRRADRLDADRIDRVLALRRRADPVARRAVVGADPDLPARAHPAAAGVARFRAEIEIDRASARRRGAARDRRPGGRAAPRGRPRRGAAFGASRRCCSFRPHHSRFEVLRTKLRWGER